MFRKNIFPKFSLSSKQGLPDAAMVDGSPCHIRTDYKTILRCMKLIGDPDVVEEHKPAILARMFFIDPPPFNALDVFIEFVNCGEEASAGGEQDFDFEQDAMELYSAFIQVYGIDLLDDSPPMHWWRFKALLTGLFATDTAIASKVELRHSKDAEGKKKASHERAYRNAKIKQSVSMSEAARQEEITRRLQAGESLEGVI